VHPISFAALQIHFSFAAKFPGMPVDVFDPFDAQTLSVLFQLTWSFPKKATISA